MRDAETPCKFVFDYFIRIQARCLTTVQGGGGINTVFQLHSDKDKWPSSVTLGNFRSAFAVKAVY